MGGRGLLTSRECIGQWATSVVRRRQACAGERARAILTAVAVERQADGGEAEVGESAQGLGRGVG